MIFTFFDIFTDIKFSRCHTILTVPHLVTIYPNIKSTLYSCKVNICLTLYPFTSDCKFSSIGTNRIMIIGNIRWVDSAQKCDMRWAFIKRMGERHLTRSGKWIVHIGINRISITLHFHIGGDGNQIPFAIIK